MRKARGVGWILAGCSVVMAACGGWRDELQHIYFFASQEPLHLRLEDMLELENLGFSGHQWCHIDAGGQTPLTDDQPALASLSRDLVTEHRRQSLAHRRQLSWH